VIISFFNNHSDGHDDTANVSAAMVVALDLTTMTARVVKSYLRPDSHLTKLRGNAQRLDNGNMFVCWSENTYISEFTNEGQLVMEAKMASHRFNTYRAYKFNFTATPSEPIALKSFVYGVTPESSTTVIYTSWNGATEVASWNFYSSENGEPSLIGNAKRASFETTFMASGTAANIMVEALDINGRSLGKSAIVRSELPSSWESQETGDETSNPTDLFGHSQSADFQSEDEHIRPVPPEGNDWSGSSDEGTHTPEESAWTFTKAVDVDHASIILTAVAVLTVLSVSIVVLIVRRRMSARRSSPTWMKCEMSEGNV
jgi:hypothetical protein